MASDISGARLNHNERRGKKKKKSEASNKIASTIKRFKMALSQMSDHLKMSLRHHRRRRCSNPNNKWNYVRCHQTKTMMLFKLLPFNASRHLCDECNRLTLVSSLLDTFDFAAVYFRWFFVPFFSRLLMTTWPTFFFLGIKFDDGADRKTTDIFPTLLPPQDKYVSRGIYD